MEKYEHITKMENIMISCSELLREIGSLLDSLDTSREEYRELISYYYSDQRSRDLDDDAHHLIPENISRGVLSEDEIFDLIGDYRDTALRMMETGLQMIKE